MLSNFVIFILTMWDFLSNFSFLISFVIKFSYLYFVDVKLTSLWNVISLILFLIKFGFLYFVFQQILLSFTQFSIKPYLIYLLPRQKFNFLFSQIYRLVRQIFLRLHVERSSNVPRSSDRGNKILETRTRVKHIFTDCTVHLVLFPGKLKSISTLPGPRFPDYFHPPQR